MSPAEKTISFLRNLTFDGYLTSQEVWSLAKFLNVNEDCQGSWPGDILTPLLGAAFEDGELTNEEMSALAGAIGQIEEEWIQQVSSGQIPDLAMDVPVFTAKPVMPSWDLKIPVEGRRGDVSYLVDLKEHTCTCPEAAERQGWPPGHPGRCCKHLALALARTGKVLPPWLQALVDHCFKHGRGTPPTADWLLVEIGARRPVLVSSGDGEWSDIYSPGADGYEHFRFNRLQNRWSFGAAPMEGGLLQQAMGKHFGAA